MLGAAANGPTVREGAHAVELRLRPGRRHAVLHGHPWVFSNQLVELPGGLRPGDEVVVREHDGRFVGRGHGHPSTLISARILERNQVVALDEDWLESRLRAALDLRRRVLPERKSFRWVHAEADGLPGLVIDLYGEGEPGGGARAVLSANSAGMERWRGAIEHVLRARIGLPAALWKCSGRGRALEGLGERVEEAWGLGSASPTWLAGDESLTLEFDPWEGQKTGLFLDMWENRRRMAAALGRGRVADLFSYVGAWGLAAARAGAEEVTCVDRSEAAASLVRANAARNGVAARVRAVCGDADRWLAEQPDRSFDALICDPPAFIQSRKDVAAGQRAYRALFARALGKVKPGGVAVLASCSHHLFEERFAELVAEAGAHAHRALTLLLRGGQAPCHPVPLVFPEARYLKCSLVGVD
jgi:23S rRNA (cytosine1962-C5)-methyltransferase